MISIRPNFLVDDLDRAVDFYERTLGFEVRVRAPEFGLAILGSGDVALALLAGSDTGPAGAYIEVEDVDAAYRRCRTVESAAVPEPPTERPWGLRDFGMRDPWGNFLGIGQRIG